MLRFENVKKVHNILTYLIKEKKDGISSKSRRTFAGN